MKKAIILMSLMLVVVLSSYAQTGKMKAGYIYQFTKLIEWPEEYKSGDFVIGILGKSDAAETLNQMASSKKVVNQTIVVKEYGSVSEIGKCHVLFVASSQSGNLSGALGKLGSSSSLVIGDKPGLAKDGAGISFIEQGGKLAFEMSQSNCTSRGLTVNSQLVNLAAKKY